MGNDTEPSATAAELVRSFSHWKSLSSDVPVTITQHGQPTHVLLGVALFQSLSSGSGVQSVSSQEDEVSALADWIDEGLLICDEEMRITYCNRVANAIFRLPSNDLIGMDLHSALPSISGTLFDIHTRRTLVGGEPSSADIPSPFTEGAWLRFKCFPLNRRTVILFRDITEDVRRYRLADVKTAILEAMTIHGSIGYVRLSVRGTIERVDAPFCDIVGLGEERLNGVAIVDLVAREDRIAFREVLEGVLTHFEPNCHTCNFLSNNDGLVMLQVSLVPLKGAYGAEGAVLLLTKHQD